jgi:hypothetical protein
MIRWVRCTIALLAGFTGLRTIETPLRAEIVEQAGIRWHTDYGDAMRFARLERKMLCVYFHGVDSNPQRRAFEDRALRDERVRAKFARYTALRLPVDAEITVDGQSTRVLDHPAFADLRRGQGLAVLDLTDPTSPQYSRVVSVVPFANGKYYRFRPQHVRVLLDLPQGTLTQRTMVFAVRIHPEGPASTIGSPDPTLMSEAASHSRHQARIRLQGHHAWDRRFHRISNLLGGILAREVVAESWPQETLVDAAVDCVDSWRQSPGHWGAVRARHARFGYDIRRGSNGIWYATGLFGGG